MHELQESPAVAIGVGESSPWGAEGRQTGHAMLEGPLQTRFKIRGNSRTLSICLDFACVLGVVSTVRYLRQLSMETTFLITPPLPDVLAPPSGFYAMNLPSQMAGPARGGMRTQCRAKARPGPILEEQSALYP